VSGIGADVSFWRRLTYGVVVLGVLLIVVAYTLNICVKLGVYGPLRKARQHAIDEEDYQHYAAYDDLAAPPAPVGGPAMAPVAAPTAAAVAGVVRRLLAADA